MLRKHTNLRVAHYCGDMNVDYWDRRRWAKELAEQDVWVMTPQILLNILRHGFIKVWPVMLLACDPDVHEKRVIICERKQVSTVPIKVWQGNLESVWHVDLAYGHGCSISF